MDPGEITSSPPQMKITWSLSTTTPASVKGSFHYPRTVFEGLVRCRCRAATFACFTRLSRTSGLCFEPSQYGEEHCCFCLLVCRFREITRGTALASAFLLPFRPRLRLHRVFYSFLHLFICSFYFPSLLEFFFLTQQDSRAGARAGIQNLDHRARSGKPQCKARATENVTVFIICRG